MTAVVDYRALRKQVKEKQQSRRTLKYPICLDSSLYDEFADLQEQQRQETIDGIGDTTGDVRAGDADTTAKIEAVEASIKAASIVAVFNIPTPEQQATREAAWQEVLKVESASDRLQHVVESARANVIDNFAHFLDHDGNQIPAAKFGLEDLREIVEDWPQGLLFSLSKEITDRSTEEPELPFSVRRSLLHPTSAETSK